MLKQLRIRFVTAAMIGMLLITTLVVGAINGVNYYNTVKSIYGMLDLITFSGGDFHKPSEDYNNQPQPPVKPEGDIGFQPAKDFPNKDKLAINDETPFITRFFVASFDYNNKLISINVDNIASFTYEEAEEIAREIATEEYGYGKAGNYFYLYEQKENGSQLIYLDSKKDMDTCKDFLLISLGVAGVSLILELIILILLSKRVVKPVVESVMKQKVFITDASHELKTPLTIISANAEVLEITDGENEWITSIKNQTSRMTKLVNDMVYLAKMDEESGNEDTKNFNLSHTVQDVVSAFEPVVKSKALKLTEACEDNIIYEGNEQRIKQLLIILIDNAMKYVESDGTIRVSCSRAGKKVFFKVFNTCQHLEEEQLKHLFDRFYRFDKSRSRQTGGSGIGLSIAKAIVDMHEGMSIRADNVEQGIEFTVTFKL